MVNFFCYPNLGTAQKAILKADKSCTIVRHELKADEKVEIDSHPGLKEWVVINSGSFVMGVGGQKFSFDISCQRRAYIVVEIAVGKSHWLRAVSDINYLVIRGK